MSRSTTSRLNALRPPSGSVLVTTTTMSDWMPEVMKVFAPLTTHPPSTFLPVVRMPCRSLPVPGSVMAIAAISSPLHRRGSQRACCSGVPSSAK